MALHLHSAAFVAALFVLESLLVQSARPALMSEAIKQGSQPQPHATSLPRPDYHDYAKMARWLTHESDWGTLSTLDKETKTPYGGVVSHSDGVGSSATGRLFFYLTPMDVSTQNLLADPHASYTLVEEQLNHLGGCNGIDPEDPTCAKISLLGRVLPVPREELKEARDAMFGRHPDMADWPATHAFAFFELHVQEVDLLDWYGGMHRVSAEDYYGAQLEGAAVALQRM